MIWGLGTSRPRPGLDPPAAAPPVLCSQTAAAAPGPNPNRRGASLFRASHCGTFPLVLAAAGGAGHMHACRAGGTPRGIQAHLSGGGLPQIAVQAAMIMYIQQGIIQMGARGMRCS